MEQQGRVIVLQDLQVLSPMKEGPSQDAIHAHPIPGLLLVMGIAATSYHVYQKDMQESLQVSVLVLLVFMALCGSSMAPSLDALHVLLDSGPSLGIVILAMR